MTDKEELRNLADRCKMWASHPVPFAGSFGDVVADGATVKAWGSIPELAPVSQTEPLTSNPQTGGKESPSATGERQK